MILKFLLATCSVQYLTSLMFNPLFQFPLRRLVKFLQKQPALQVCLLVGIVFQKNIVMGRSIRISFISVVLICQAIRYYSLQEALLNILRATYRFTRFTSFAFRPRTVSERDLKVRPLERELWKEVSCYI